MSVLTFHLKYFRTNVIDDKTKSLLTQCIITKLFKNAKFIEEHETILKKKTKRNKNK